MERRFFDMEIFRRAMGPLETNSYVVSTGKSCMVIDPGFPKESVELAEFIIERKLRVEYIIATHGHFDHVLGVDKLRERLGYKPKFYIHIDDLNLLAKAGDALNQFFGVYVKPPKPDVYLYGGERFTLNGIVFEIIHTPGHTRGSICIYIESEKIMFTGDTLFRGSIGRFDFPESDENLMRKSLQRLANMDPEIRIFPGHGNESTLKNELEFNGPFRDMLGLIP